MNKSENYCCSVKLESTQILVYIKCCLVWYGSKSIQNICYCFRSTEFLSIFAYLVKWKTDSWIFIETATQVKWNYHYPLLKTVQVSFSFNHKLIYFHLQQILLPLSMIFRSFSIFIYNRLINQTGYIMFCGVLIPRDTIHNHASYPGIICFWNIPIRCTFVT